MLTHEQTLEMIACYQNTKCDRTLQKLLVGYSRMCIGIARAYANTDWYDDAIQEAYVALIGAISTFDATRSSAFTAYASVAVRREVNRKVKQMWSVIHVPDSKEILKAYRRMSRYSHQRTLSQADAEALANELSINVRDVFAAYSLYHSSTISMDQKVSSTDADAITFGDMISSEDEYQDPALAVEHSQAVSFAHERLDECLSRFPQRDADIYRERRASEKTRGLADLGKRYGISAERVRQIENQVHNKVQMLSVA